MSKKKLKVLYEKEYCEEISTWKIERVIRRYKLYPDQNKAEKTARKGTRALKASKEKNNSASEGRETLFSLSAEFERATTKLGIQRYF